jgi:hypothetical protein
MSLLNWKSNPSQIQETLKRLMLVVSEIKIHVNDEKGQRVSCQISGRRGDS